MADEGRSRQDIWSSEASLSLLGPVRLSSKTGDEITPKARKTRALLAVTALAKGNVPRAQLTNLLWGDRGEEQAKASLRQALYELRDLTGVGLLTVTREFVSAGPKRIWTDVGAIETALAKSDDAALADALDEVQWPPLADLDDVTPELDEWLRDERNRITSLVVQRGNELAESSLSSGNAASARRIADALLRIDPLDERTVQAGARADIALGDRAAAHRRITRFEQRMRDELGLEPSPATLALLKETPAPDLPREAGAERQQPASAHWKRRLIPALALLVVALIAGTAFLLRPGAASANPSVAVLPFESAGQEAQGYFASGVSDEILNLLSHDQSIRVLGRVSAEEIARRPNALEAARELGITHLLDGSVQSAGDRVLVIVTLTRVSDGAQMWSERYERRVGDIFAVQGDIASTVASRLTSSFGKPASQSTSPDAYDRYLAARQLLRDRREVTLKEADKLLREAIRLDPNYAPAYAELSQVLILRSDAPTSYGPLPVNAARTEAKALARKAVQLDPNLGDAYAALGFLYLYDPKATPFYRKAIALNPQRSEYHRWLAQSLWFDHHFDEALVEYRRAVEIDPLWGINYEHLTGQLNFVGRHAEAVEIARRFLALSSDDRAKLQLLRSLANDDDRVADTLRYARALYSRFPNERIMRFWLASPLSLLGEQKRAAQLMNYDPISQAILSSDWPRLAKECERLGPSFWDRAYLWNAARLLIATGHSGVLVKLYDAAPVSIRSGALSDESISLPETAFALRKAGRRAEADKLLEQYSRNSAKLPNLGVGHLQRQLDMAILEALAGQNDAALKQIDSLSRSQPIALASIPAMSLIYNPIFQAFKDDPRLLASDERLRAATNSERAKAGMPPIGRENWISDPKTLLTKN